MYANGPSTSKVDSFLILGLATVQAGATAAEGAANGTQVGAIYNLSKRTGLYVAYGKTTATLLLLQLPSKALNWQLAFATASNPQAGLAS
jgi:hypothetical protein